MIREQVAPVLVGNRHAVADALKNGLHQAQPRLQLDDGAFQLLLHLLSFRAGLQRQDGAGEVLLRVLEGRGVEVDGDFLSFIGPEHGGRPAEASPPMEDIEHDV